MSIRFSRESIESFCGDVLPLQLLSGEDHFAAPVRWYTEGDAVTLRTFEKEAEFPFRDGVLLTLLHPGQAQVCAELYGTVYRCAVTVRPRRTLSENDPLNYYAGDFHLHTTTEHNHTRFAARKTGFPIDCIETLRREGKMDFHVISDHASTLNPRDFFRGFTDAQKAQPMEMVVFPGSESEVEEVERDRYGYAHKNSGEIVTVNADSFAGVPTFTEFCDALAHSPHAVCVLAHPQIIGYSVPGVWNFCLHKNNTPALRRLVKMVETGNGGDRESNLINEYIYSVALDNGFRVSTTCSSDAHSGWSFHSFPGKTILMAYEKSKEAFLDALMHNRVYGCESGNVKLSCTVNGHRIPCDLPAAERYEFRVELSYFTEDESTVPVKCQLISDGGRTLATVTDPGSSFTIQVESDSARYFYLRLVDREGRKTWSPPVWTGRPWVNAPQPPLTPLDKSGFTAVDESSGTDAAALLTDDPGQIWQALGCTASVVIDMKKVHTVSAVGHYPPPLTRAMLKETNAAPPEKIAEFVHDYAISVSRDGVTYEPCAEGAIRIYGGEEILSFAPREARYVKFEILTTAGRAGERPRHADARPSVGELTVFAPAE